MRLGQVQGMQVRGTPQARGLCAAALDPIGDPLTAAVLVPEEFPAVLSSRRFSDRRGMRRSISIASRNRERVLLEFNHGPPAEFNLEPPDERSLLSSDSTSF